MISSLLFPSQTFCTESKEVLGRYIQFYVDFLEDKKEAALGVFVVAILINFVGIRARRISLSAIIYSGFLWGSKSLERSVVAELLRHQDKSNTYHKVLTHIKDLLEKINDNGFFMAFICISLGIVVFFFVKVAMYILMAGLVYYLWRVLEISIDGKIEGNPYYVYQGIMLCIGLLTLILVKQTAFVIYFVIFVAFGSLFIIIGANSGFGLNLEISESFSSFLNKGFNSMTDDKVILGYISLVSMGLICQMFLMKRKE